MNINLYEITKKSGEKLAISLEIPSIKFDDCTIFSIKVNGFVINNQGRLELNLNINGKLNAVCARCLADIDRDFSLIVNERLTNDENNPEDVYYSNNSLDIQNVVTQAISLNLPLVFICSDDCEGLLAEMPDEEPQNTLLSAE
ncbi:MAG: DUF177 domain-containing protein [Clostridiales bacterium]|jgi:uncharacterized protein|nr:DUF177 domain-containing protein [Clostridiales bacterium]